MQAEVNATRPRIGVLMGDPAGIGPEISLKVLAMPEVHALCRPVLVGDCTLLAATAAEVAPTVTVFADPEYPSAPGGHARPAATGAQLAVPCLDCGHWPVQPGVPSKAAGEVAHRSIALAFEAAKAGYLQGIAMAPLNKQSLHETGLGFQTDQDLMRQLTGVEEIQSVVRSGHVVRGIVVNHVAFREIAERLTVDAILRTGALVGQTAALFTPQRPRVAVAALNPHGGEGGLFGDEEARVISPAIEELRRRGMDVHGPLPADTVFLRAWKGEFDAVISLYHDQGNIAFKALAFEAGVSVYAGLPFVLTTPAHGSAYDIAGKGIANPANMLETVKAAAIACRKR